LVNKIFGHLLLDGVAEPVSWRPFQGLFR